MFERCGVVLVVSALVLAGCNEETAVDPKLVDGAGIRFLFPAGADSLSNVQVELWDDAHNGIPAPDCLITAQSGVVRPAGAAVDSCTRMSVEIRNWMGELTRSIPDTSFHGSLAWGWDQLDNDGHTAAPGIYAIESACLDSQGSFTFSGHYYVADGAALGNCQWVLWSRALSANELHVAEFGPFPTLGKTETFYQEQLREVGFVSPFTVRVYASGMWPFEQTIDLTEGEYTDVAVTWEPMSTVGGGERSR